MQKYITGNYRWKFSTFVFDLQCFIQHVLYLIFVAPIFNVTVTLIQHCAISNGPLYVVSYFMQIYYQVLLYHQLCSHSLLSLYFHGYYINWFVPSLAEKLITNMPHVWSVDSYRAQISIVPETESSPRYPIFYARSHLSAPQSCKSIISTSF